MRQVRAGKANVSEPPLKRRKRSGVIETGVQSLPRDEPGGCLLTGQVVTGVKVARARFRRQHGTWEPLPRWCWPGVGPASRREFPKQRKLQGAEYRCGAGGGPSRSSGEA